MYKNDYFNALTKDCSSNYECIIQILRARGFFLDSKNNEFYLSDNADYQDLRYLNLLLKEFELGHITYIPSKVPTHQNYIANNKIVPFTARIELLNTATIDQAIKAFCSSGKVGGEVSRSTCSWKYFAHCAYGRKAPVEVLEPYIAYMVKALSACGVHTNCSCDGNHNNGKPIYITSDYPFNLWQKLLISQLPNNNKIQGLDHGITFNRHNQFDLYYELFLAAEYLYKHRIAFRTIKKESTSFLTTQYIKNHDDRQILMEFSKNCEKLFNERRTNINDK